MASSTRQLLDVLKGLSDLVANAEKEANDLATLREAYSEKDKMYREECKRSESFKGSHRDCQTRQDKDKAIIEKLREEKVSLENALREKQKELEENRQRLSKIMGMKIMDKNPEIADLSDPNRPTKLGERYGELYDNEWTDAFETLSKHNDEKQVVTKLHDIFKFVFQYCYKLSREQEEDLKRAMLVPPFKMKEVLPDFVLKEFKDNRKFGSNDFLKSHFETFQREYRSCHSYESGIDSFVKECFEISWLMNIQDPPIEIDTKTGRHDAFDSNVYKAYTVSGTTIDFVVWPTARLHQGGPILFKGVAQCIPRPASSIASSQTKSSNDQTRQSRTRPSTALSSTRRSPTRKTGSDENNTTQKPSVTDHPATTADTVTFSASRSARIFTDSKTGIDDTYTKKKPSVTNQSASTTVQDIDDLLSSYLSTTTLSENLSNSARNKNLSPAGIHRSQPKEAWTDSVAGKEGDVSSEPAGSGTPQTNYDQDSRGIGQTSAQYGTQSVRTGRTGQQQNMVNPQYSPSSFAPTSSASPSYTQTNVNTTSYQSNAGGIYQHPVQQYFPTQFDINVYYGWMPKVGPDLTREYMGAERFDAVRNYIYERRLPYAKNQSGQAFI